MAKVTIDQLQAAISLNGTELIPIDQPNGAGGFVTKKTTIGAISTFGINAEYLLASGNPMLPQARILAGASGQITLTDGGPEGNMTVGLAPSGVTAATYGNGTSVPQITVDAEGRITLAQSVDIANQGNVAGPASSVAGHIATFADATGKLLSDGGALGTAASHAATDFASSALTITAGTGLTGGGDLTANRTIALNAASIASLALANSSLQPSILSSTATIGLVPQFLNVDGSGIPGIALAATGMILRQSNPTMSTVYGLSVERLANYTGTQSPGFEGNALKVTNTVSSTAGNYENGIEVVLNNSAVDVSGVPQNSAFRAAAYKMGTGATWGQANVSIDTTGTADPTAPLIGIEQVLSANGTDANGVRQMVNLILSRPEVGGVYSGAAVTAKSGLSITRVSADAAINRFTHGIRLGVQFAVTDFDYALDLFYATSPNWLIRLPVGGVTPNSNIVIGNIGVNDIAGFGSLRVGRTTSGGIIQFGDGTNSGRISGGSSQGVIFGSETNVDTLFWRNAAEVARFKADGFHQFITASATPSSNGDLVAQATSNTSLTFKYKGTDGTVRSGSITLA